LRRRDIPADHDALGLDRAVRLAARCRDCAAACNFDPCLGVIGAQF